MTRRNRFEDVLHTNVTAKSFISLSQRRLYLCMADEKNASFDGDGSLNLITAEDKGDQFCEYIEMDATHFETSLESPKSPQFALLICEVC